MRLSALVCLALIATPAGATTAEGAAGGDAKPDWSLGVSIESPSRLVFGLGPYGGLSFSNAPTVGAGLEWRAGGDTWLTFDLFGSHDRVTSGDRDSTLSRVGARLGVRQALNPDDPFVVSVMGALGAGYNNSSHPVTYLGADDDFEDVDNTDESVSAELTAGIAVSRELTEGLALRLGVNILAAHYSTGVESSFGEDEVDTEGLSISAGLEPRLELRYAF